MLVCDVLWVSMLIYITFSELKEIVHVIRNREKGQKFYQALRAEYISFWNIVDWISLVISGVVLALAVDLFSKTMTMRGSFERLLREEVETEGVVPQDHASYLALVESFFADTEDT